jgi:hypothetical protein
MTLKAPHCPSGQRRSTGSRRTTLNAIEEGDGTMIEGALLLWYLLTAGSLIFLIWDLQTNTPATWVMKLAWVLVVLYTGPIGLFIYLLSCRQPLPGTHDRFISAQLFVPITFT